MDTFILILLSGFAIIGIWNTVAYFFRREYKSYDLYSGCTLNVEIDENEPIECKLYALNLALSKSELGNIPIVVNAKNIKISDKEEN